MIFFKKNYYVDVLFYYVMTALEQEMLDLQMIIQNLMQMKKVKWRKGHCKLFLAMVKYSR